MNFMGKMNMCTFDHFMCQCVYNYSIVIILMNIMYIFLYYVCAFHQLGNLRGVIRQLEKTSWSPIRQPRGIRLMKNKKNKKRKREKMEEKNEIF